MVTTNTALRCTGFASPCDHQVTHIDAEGYVYCTQHGEQRRRSGIRARKLTMVETMKLTRGESIPYSSKAKKQPRPSLFVGDTVKLADHVRTIPAVDGRPMVTRETMLRVRSVIGRGTQRDPWRVLVSDETHEHTWYLDPDDLTCTL